MDPISIISLAVTVSLTCLRCANTVRKLADSGKKVADLADELDVLEGALSACQKTVSIQGIQLENIMAEIEGDQDAARVRHDLFQDVLKNIKTALQHIKGSLEYLERILSSLVSSTLSKSALRRAVAPILVPILVMYRSGDIAEEQNHVRQLCSLLNTLLHALSLSVELAFLQSSRTEIGGTTTRLTPKLKSGQRRQEYKIGNMRFAACFKKPRAP